MSLVELPSRDGKIIAVNPHHVSAVQAYSGYAEGHETKREMSVVWVNGHNLYVCLWPVEQTLDVLNDARHRDAAAFEAGYRAAHLEESIDFSSADVRAAFLAWAKECDSEVTR